MSTQNNTHNKEQLLLPGRLGDPQRDWRTDPRVDPSNAWGQPPKELPSLYENEGYSNIWCSQMAVNASLYDPEHQNDNNPLCWPYRAQREDLQGLPPHVISVNESDALRDEGLKYYQMLRAAGVSGNSRTVNGTCHGSDLGFPQALPEVHAATLRDIKEFADSL